MRKENEDIEESSNTVGWFIGQNLMDASRDMFERGRKLVEDAAELFDRGRKLVRG